MLSTAGSTRATLLLMVLCLAVAATAVTWKAWDMFGPARKPMLQRWNDSFYYFWLPAVVINHDLDFSRPLATSGTVTAAVGYFLLGAALPAAVQLIAWKMLFGSWIAYSYGGESFSFSDLHLRDVLLSPNHGFFYWHPLLLVGITAVLLWSRSNRIAWPWLISFGAITILNAAWPCWWFASSFGNRGFEVPIFFGMFGIAVLFAATDARPVWRRVVVGTVCAAVVWNLVVFALFLTRRILQESAVTWSDDVGALGEWVGRGAPAINAAKIPARASTGVRLDR